MAKENETQERRLPIKVILTHDDDHRRPHQGGDKRKVFDNGATPEVRQRLVGQLEDVRKYFDDVIPPELSIPAVARVVLKKDALAKSHRPLTLLDRNTCPIIGGREFGDLLVHVSSDGLNRLESKIARSTTYNIEAQISTIDYIKPFTAEDAAGKMGIDTMQSLLVKKKIDTLQLRLFDHKNGSDNDQIRHALLTLASELGLPEPESVPYLSGLRIYRIKKVVPKHVSSLAGFAGTQSIGFFPQFTFRLQYFPCGQVTKDNFPPPDPDRDYPLVGIIDSGTDPNNTSMQQWVVVRDEQDVPPADQDNSHGSFVAGLIINSRAMNHGDTRFPETQAKIVDVVAMPKSGTSGEDLLDTIRRAVKTYRKVSVWNLSFRMVDELCCDDCFSLFAMELDAIQKKYGVIFVTCAGNYEENPLRTWPPQDLGERDRICSPADNVLGVTVGSLAHLYRPNSLVKIGEPSPFSRRGPGAAFLPKPEVCHYGGNCSAEGNCRQVGVVSIDGSGNLAEAVGTSFSTPLIASVLTNIRSSVVEPISRNLAKALLIHSAALENGLLDPKELRYKGFGKPGEIAYMLTCAPWQATMIFEPEITPTLKIFAREEFPIPACFRNEKGKIKGEILMTLVYDPPLAPSAGAEYCQANVDVSLGTYEPSATCSHMNHCKKVPLEPKDKTELFEKIQLEHGFKWSPVKVYRERFTRTTGEHWRIQMQLSHRTELYELPPQNVALVVSLIDPEEKLPVYNDVIKAMNRSGWVQENLKIDNRIRQQLHG